MRSEGRAEMKRVDLVYGQVSRRFGDEVRVFPVAAGHGFEANGICSLRAEGFDE